MSTLAHRYDLAPEDRDVADRILRKRVSEDGLKNVIKRLGTAFQAHMTARMQTLSPDLVMAFETMSDPSRPGKPPAGNAETAGFTFYYPEERCRLALHLDRQAAGLVNGALLGCDPEADMPPSAGEISQLEIGVLHSLAVAAGQTRQTDRPLLGFGRVDIYRGDDPALIDETGDAVATLSFSITFGVNRAWCWLDVPHRLLIDLSATLAADEARAAQANQRHEFKVPDFDLTVEVILPLAEMTLAEVARLKPGDVIESAPAAGGDAVLRAKGRDLFTTQIGRVGHANAVRIQGPIAPIAAALRAHAHQHTIKGGQ
ncbi:FliM/FliN family flagellar motor C-terminal domain-containing protein [Oceaniradius stylonematis]|uniref:FliM/FliN family flagellar motor C-terminal domain-containing protein n=1 Tax=Oceaniradius stylonematis TaxID=2184161 RepID=UPI00273FCD35|nr:FliM/FliN family flagellar motor switch protein [Oceaniradius stylonematis]